jgi:hypothetical protein
LNSSVQNCNLDRGVHKVYAWAETFKLGQHALDTSVKSTHPFVCFLFAVTLLELYPGRATT